MAILLGRSALVNFSQTAPLCLLSQNGQFPRAATANAAAEDVTRSAFFHVERDSFLGVLRCSDFPTDLSPSSSNGLRLSSSSPASGPSFVSHALISSRGNLSLTIGIMD
ncbi:hypothetical protein T06_4928 [Trichinella sp. T6]|nr:hypothetical protein T06_4928 [Trichinella sp. T6]